jgi:hypothetical protein
MLPMDSHHCPEYRYVEEYLAFHYGQDKPDYMPYKGENKPSKHLDRPLNSPPVQMGPFKQSISTSALLMSVSSGCGKCLPVMARHAPWT